MDLRRVVTTWVLLFLHAHGVRFIIPPSVAYFVGLLFLPLSPVIALVIARRVAYDTREAFWSSVVLFVVGIVLWTVLRGGTVVTLFPEKLEFVMSIVIRIPLAVVAVYYSYRIGSRYANYRAS